MEVDVWADQHARDDVADDDWDSGPRGERGSDETHGGDDAHVEHDRRRLNHVPTHPRRGFARARALTLSAGEPSFPSRARIAPQATKRCCCVVGPPLTNPIPFLSVPYITNPLLSAAFLNTSATSLYHPVAYEVAMAKMDRCPICNVAVKPENLIRHLNDIHPRHPDRPGLIEKLKEEPGRIQRPRAGRPIRIRRWQIALVAIIVLGGLGAIYVNANRPTSPDRKSTRLNSSHDQISYAVFCLKKKKKR